MSARFSLPVSRPSTAENWPTTPIASGRCPALRHVVASDPDLGAIGTDQRGQDVHGSVLAGAVGPEQREDRSLR
jgi:hypothetical protein